MEFCTCSYKYHKNIPIQCNFQPSSSYAFIASTLSPSHGSIFSSLVSFASFHFPVIFASVDMALSFSVPSELNISFFTFLRSATSGAYCASSSASPSILSFAIVFISALTSFTILLACGVSFLGIQVVGSYNTESIWRLSDSRSASVISPLYSLI